MTGEDKTNIGKLDKVRAPRIQSWLLLMLAMFGEERQQRDISRVLRGERKTKTTKININFAVVEDLVNKG